MAVNLLKETLEILEEYKKSPKDVEWVGSRDGKYAITWNEFEKIADIEYYNGYGTQEVAEDLVVVGEDWWLERHEYDGSEWWEFKTLPVKQSKTVKFTKILTTPSAWDLDLINKTVTEDLLSINQ